MAWIRPEYAPNVNFNRAEGSDISKNIKTFNDIVRGNQASNLALLQGMRDDDLKARDLELTNEFNKARIKSIESGINIQDEMFKDAKMRQANADAYMAKYGFDRGEFDAHLALSNATQAMNKEYNIYNDPVLRKIYGDKFVNSITPEDVVIANSDPSSYENIHDKYRASVEDVLKRLYGQNVNPEEIDYLLGTTMIESSGNPNAKSSKSSANGLMQMTAPAMKDVVNSPYGRALQLSTDDDMSDPTLNYTYAAIYNKQQEDQYRAKHNLNRALTYGERRNLHNFGVGGASVKDKYPGNTKFEDAFRLEGYDHIVKANPHLIGKSLNQVFGDNETKIKANMDKFSQIRAKRDTDRLLQEQKAFADKQAKMAEEERARTSHIVEGLSSLLKSPEEDISDNDYLAYASKSSDTKSSKLGDLTMIPVEDVKNRLGDLDKSRGLAAMLEDPNMVFQGHISSDKVKGLSEFGKNTDRNIFRYGDNDMDEVSAIGANSYSKRTSDNLSASIIDAYTPREDGKIDRSKVEGVNRQLGVTYGKFAKAFSDDALNEALYEGSDPILSQIVFHQLAVNTTNMNELVKGNKGLQQAFLEFIQNPKKYIGDSNRRDGLYKALKGKDRELLDSVFNTLDAADIILKDKKNLSPMEQEALQMDDRNYIDGLNVTYDYTDGIKDTSKPKYKASGVRVLNISPLLPKLVEIGNKIAIDKATKEGNRKVKYNSMINRMAKVQGDMTPSEYIEALKDAAAAEDMEGFFELIDEKKPGRGSFGNRS